MRRRARCRECLWRAIVSSVVDVPACCPVCAAPTWSEYVEPPAPRCFDAAPGIREQWQRLEDRILGQRPPLKAELAPRPLFGQQWRAGVPYLTAEDRIFLRVLRIDPGEYLAC